MTKKDYEKIAGVFKARLDRLSRENLPPHEFVNTRGEIKRFAFDFARMLASDNARFRKQTFIVACGFGEDDDE